MIKQLGGEYIECPNFVERCTHIVLGRPNTGEKYMGGLMTGKWLLKTEYVEDSYAEGYWLEEEKYEWTKDVIERFVFFWRSKFVSSFVTKYYNYKIRYVPYFRTFIPA